ncbi:hypothetical protein DFA_06249 [Cavenderia fasciculata]|uniref:Multi antimicrobial extrusion family protein n=1 Tax=Cavenderia fasciculata TaxID=261658 RepID=F4PKI6_CACFS|nr:uncharacterized protein DFA_06249 [Cavenderia fasciculata]EGG24110.1 hypothetical protein DFA_06249 [Cavenderia fasciculata]|eukprot:XP_004361961.1 hypothetical protein DFA_06249 [Cavenderia fasciculata]
MNAHPSILHTGFKEEGVKYRVKGQVTSTPLISRERLTTLHGCDNQYNHVNQTDQEVEEEEEEEDNLQDGVVSMPKEKEKEKENNITWIKIMMMMINTMMMMMVSMINLFNQLVDGKDSANISIKFIIFVLFNFVNLTVIGHVGKNELAAVALGNTWQIATSAFTLGGLSAMDTLISQAYGAKQFQLIGITVQRAFIIVIIINILVSILWSNTENILLLCRQDKEISALAQQYTIYMIPGLCFGSFIGVFQKYLQAQGIMAPVIIVGLISNVLNAILNYIFVYGIGMKPMGVVGCALSTSISKAVGFFILLAWILIFKLHQRPIKTWYGFTWDTFSLKDFKEYIVLCIPSGLQLLFETWGFEVLTIMAGLLNAASLDAHSITMNFNLLNIMLPYSLSVAVSIRIGQLLGSGHPERARKSAKVSMFIITIIVILGVIFQLASRYQVGKVYSTDPQVIELVANLVPLSALSKVFDGYQVTCQGMLRGVGKNSLGAILHFGSFYLVGLPLAGVLTFVNIIPPIDHTVFGLWWGLNGGFIYVVCRIDWYKEMINAFERTDSSVCPTNFNSDSFIGDDDKTTNNIQDMNLLAKESILE